MTSKYISGNGQEIVLITHIVRKYFLINKVRLMATRYISAQWGDLQPSYRILWGEQDSLSTASASYVDMEGNML